MSAHEASNLRSDRAPDRAAAKITPERWQKIKELLLSAQELDPAERAGFLLEACGSDQALRDEVESLLASDDSAIEFGLSTAGLLRNTGLSAAAPDPMVGRRVGAYEIVRQIGQGGMAVVYLAVRADDAYRKQVAVKLVRSGLDNAEVLSRFRNERQTLAGLDHPNIVRLIDGGSTTEGLPFLVMDYVEGTPIDDYCDHQQLSIEARLRLFCTVCTAVQYAHRNLVIHRDLKPSNILVTTEGVPKLLDFGISKVLHPDPVTQTLQVTQTGTRRMTPAYASPEQVRCEPVTLASDIYSLGVLLYELLTGHRPYKLKQSIPAEMERAICEQEPENPSTAVDRVETETSRDGTSCSKTPESVSRTREGEPDRLRRRLRGDLDTIVLMALRKEPQRRYGSVEGFSQDIQRHLDHLPVKARRNTFAYRASKFIRRRQTEVVATAIMLSVLLGAGLFAAWEERRATERAQAELRSQRSTGRLSVAVLGFKNLAGQSETAWLSTALSEMLTTELAAGGKLRTIPGEDVAQTKQDLALPDADSFKRGTLQKIHRNLGSDFVLTGSYVEIAENPRQIRLDLRLQDAVLGETVAAWAESGSQNELSEIAARAGADLRQKLGVAGPASAEKEAVKASLPASPEAMKLYAEGLEKLRFFDALGGRDLLEKSVAAEPKFALAHSALSSAWSALGNSAETQKEAKLAFDLASGLPRDQSLMVEGRYYEATRQWDKAIEIYQTLFKFYPDNLPYGLQLAEAQAAAAKGNESLATIEILRRLPGPDGNDARIDLAEGQAANVVSDYKRQEAAAERAVQKAQTTGARLQFARARIVQARALMELGQLDKVGPAMAEAIDAFTAAGNRFGAARSLQQVGLTFYYKGKFDEAKKAYQEALAIQRSLGNRPNEAKLLNGLGLIQWKQDDLAGAKQAFEQTLLICREVDDRAMTGTALGNLAGVEYNLGDYQNTKKHIQEALDIARQVGEQSGIALQLNNLGLVLVADANPQGAKPLYQESLQISRKTGKSKDLVVALDNLADLELSLGELDAARKTYRELQTVAAAGKDENSLGIALIGIGEVDFQQGDTAAARKSYEQAIVNLEKTGDTRFLQQARLFMAEVDLETGNPASAEKVARQTVEEFRKAKDPDSQANGEVLLVRVLLAQHKTEEAQSVAADAVKLATQGGTRSTQLAGATAQAEVQMAAANASESAASLRQVVADCQKAGWVPLGLEAGLALGEAQIKEGNRNGGRTQLTNVAREAQAKGFLLIAHKASAAKNHS